MKKILAIATAFAATPVNPNKADAKAIKKNVTDNRNTVFSFFIQKA